MSDFFVTFGMQYPREQHPSWPYAHHDGWLRVEAPSYDAARGLVVARLGTAWSMLYTASEHEPEYYPRGELGVLRTDGSINDDRARALLTVETDAARAAVALFRDGDRDRP